MKRIHSLMSERGEARAVLASVLAIVLVVGLLQVAATFFAGGRAFGQSSASPTSGFTIQFLNPTGGTSREMSSKNDGTDSEYHLVAWVNSVPPNATVEFKYQSNASNSIEVNIGEGTLVGSDTYEIKWNMSQLGASDEATNPSSGAGAPANSGKVRAILYSGSSEVARDEEAVRINQQAAPTCPSAANPPPCFEENQANTVEMTYPTNSGPLGYYRPNPGNGPLNAVFNATTSNGTLSTEAFYTLSAPGTEPSWKACRKGSSDHSETKAESEDGIRCEFAAGDSAAAVRAVAVVAHDETEPILGDAAEDDTDTADAHRVFPYEQDIATVELANGSQTQDAGKCTPVVTATLKDQVGRTVADANVDVHATGPADELQFDDGGGSTHYSAPNKAPENHPTEAARDCETATNPPNSSDLQGDHEELGPADRKHIESSVDTNDAGQWKFALYSGVAGQTQFTAWADEDSNDRLCSGEAQADGSVGWGEAAPAVTGLPDEDTSCPRPGPSGSASSSPSASPSRSASPSGSASSPSQQSRTITLAASRARVGFGATVTLAGQLFASDSDCEDDEFVRITRRVHGQPNATELTTTRTDAEGRYSVEIAARRGAEYQAVSPGHDDCGDAQSSPVNVQVRVRIGIKASDLSVERGDKVRLRVKVTPAHAGTTVVLQSKAPGRSFRPVKKAELNRRGVAVFVVEADWPKRTFRARWKSQHDDHEGNTSRAITVRSKR